MTPEERIERLQAALKAQIKEVFIPLPMYPSDDFRATVEFKVPEGATRRAYKIGFKPEGYPEGEGRDSEKAKAVIAEYVSKDIAENLIAGEVWLAELEGSQSAPENRGGRVMEKIVAIVEIMGHQVTAGQISEETHFGVPLMRVDVPASSHREGYTVFYGGQSIYRITPTTEDVVKAFVESQNPEPVKPYMLALPTYSSKADHLMIDEYGSPHEYGNSEDF